MKMYIVCTSCRISKFKDYCKILGINNYDITLLFEEPDCKNDLWALHDYASSSKLRAYVNIKIIDELIKIYDLLDCELVIKKEDDDYYIEIYDDYRE